MNPYEPAAMRTVVAVMTAITGGDVQLGITLVNELNEEARRDFVEALLGFASSALMYISTLTGQPPDKTLQMFGYQLFDK